MTFSLRLLAFAFCILMLTVDSLYGHSITGKVATLFLFLLAASLALASLGDEDNSSKKD